MKSTQAPNPRPTTQPAIFRLTASSTLVERMRQISASIAGRAYELFEARGSEHGHDWEDWFRAESELLTPIPVKVVDLNGRFAVRAEVPGFTSKDIEVWAGPSRVIIYAKKHKITERQNEGTILQRKMSDESFCILDLPHEIEPDNITTTFKNGKVEITVPKVDMDKKITVGAKAA